MIIAGVLGAVLTGQARAACEPQEGPRFTAETASRFMAAPAKILGRDTSDYGLTVFVMQFAAARSRDLDVFKTILPVADARQQAAIGLGFYRAASFCQVVDSTVADRISAWVKKLPSREVVAAYQQAVMKNDDSAFDAPAGVATPQIESRFSDILDITPKPSASGVGSLKIPDPMRLPGD
jgi:hypothetical protein